MPSDRCRQALNGQGSLVERMHNASNAVCGCECASLSDLSPGVVQDSEELHFVVPHPDGMLNGKLNPIFLTQIDSNGLSVLREDAGDDEFVNTLKELSERWARATPVRQFHGIATFSASHARKDNDARLCCVYDTALPKKPHHADIAGPKLDYGSSSSTKKAQKARLKKLIDTALLRFETASEFREGVLSGFAKQDSSQ